MASRSNPPTGKSPFRIELILVESAELNRRATRYTLPHFGVLRAKMILIMMAANGTDNDEIAARLDTRREVVSQWRQRFFKGVSCLSMRRAPSSLAVARGQLTPKTVFARHPA